MTLPTVVTMGGRERLGEILKAVGVARADDELLRPNGGSGSDDEWEPEEGEELRGDDPRLQLLPDPATVFVADQPWLGDVLMPVLRVDLSAVDPTWSGSLPIVDPVEPVHDVQGSVGDETEESHDDHACNSWMALRLEPDGRLRFLGRRTYFLHETLRERGELTGSPVEDHYVRDALDRAKGQLRLRRTGGKGAQVFTLGGELYWGNWTVVAPPAAYRYVEPHDHAGPPGVTTADGRPFRLVGRTDRWAWNDESVASLLVLFEPETRTVLMAVEFD
ncbi:hypothetical protein IEQ44_12600 [Nocardioides sp. Y6]|uniref:Uncharacterized protein n=1 Tax=Nocardioides malaquae TaxID=2773426 RepID=A0ABR9RVA7_9ACTN|nr:hypothetical protein [Nocardioides malaquae]MBE7325491.1 hypothetical protein [Nocardioides malaquae]